MITIYDAVGLIGVSISILCYARVQWQRDYAKNLSYSVLNLISSLLIIVSIIHNWNLSAFVSNATWGTISLYGAYRCLKHAWLERSARSHA